jgi:outer membrane protein
MFGLDSHYHLLPDQSVDPWVGLGVGYEILDFNVSVQGRSSTAANGFQFFNLQFGADYKALPNLGLGPFVMFGLGQYSNCSFSGSGAPSSCTVQETALHEWLTFGVRGEYDINTGG